MYGRGGLVLVLFLIMVSLGAVYAQTDIISEIESEYPDAELETEAGISPDSFFYFISLYFIFFTFKVFTLDISNIRSINCS